MRPTRESSEAGYLFSPIWSCSGGVYPATPVTRSAVSSYLTVSPLPRSHRPKTEKPRRFVFCGTFVLGSLLLGVTQAPCPVEPGISSSLSERVQNGPRPSLRLPSRFMIEPVPILVTLYCNNRIRLTISGLLITRRDCPGPGWPGGRRRHSWPGAHGAPGTLSAAWRCRPPADRWAAGPDS